MDVKDYVPQYDNTIFEYHKNTPSVTQGINERCCLMETSARVLATILHPTPTIFLAPPIKQAPGSPFAFNKWVPFFRFPSGIERNAADLASYWVMPGVQTADILKYVQIDIDTPVEGQ